MATIRLNKVERVAVTIQPVPITRKINGKDIVTWNNYLRIAPNETRKSDDEALLNFLKSYKHKVRYNAETEKALKEYGVPYEIEYCKSCGGKIKKISYNPVEVMDNE